MNIDTVRYHIAKNLTHNTDVEDLEEVMEMIYKLSDKSISFTELLCFQYNSGDHKDARLVLDSWNIMDFSVKHGLLDGIRDPLKSVNKRIRRMKEYAIESEEPVSDYMYKETVYKSGSGSVKNWHLTTLGVMTYFMSIKGVLGFQTRSSLSRAMDVSLKLHSSMRRLDRIHILDGLLDYSKQKGLMSIEVSDIRNHSEIRMISEIFEEVRVKEESGLLTF